MNEVQFKKITAIMTFLKFKDIVLYWCLGKKDKIIFPMLIISNFQESFSSHFLFFTQLKSW